MRMEANDELRSTRALRELGTIYMKMGLFNEANEALTLAISEDRSDPKVWLYSGLAQELLDNPAEALSRLKRAPGRSQTSIYSNAIKGRIAWLEESEFLKKANELTELDTPVEGSSLDENLYVVLPFTCVINEQQYKDIGVGLSALIAHDLDQIQGINFVDVDITRLAYFQNPEVAAGTPEEKAIWAARLFGAQNVIGGDCILNDDSILNIDFVLRDVRSQNIISLSIQENINNIPALETTIIDQLLEELRIYVPNRERRMPVAGLNLETLLALSNGLVSEDERDLANSIRQYQRVLAQAPSFTSARIRLDRAMHKQLSAGETRDQLLGLLERLESDTGGTTLLDSRALQAGGNLNAGFSPDQLTRKLPPGTIGELPLPPSPTNN